MSDATVVLKIEGAEQEEVLSCNGIPEERAEVKRRFDEIMETRRYFAYVETSPGRAEQVRTFAEVEKLEKQLPVANVYIQPSLQGG